MTEKEIYERLKAALGDKILEFTEQNFDPFVTIDPSMVRDVMRFLKSTPGIEMNYLVLVTGIDYPPDRIQVVYHLYSYKHLHKLVIKANLPRMNPVIDSIADLYRTAEWHEREEFDMLGIIFRGHPYLHRILCPEDWDGYPLRKDYAMPKEYHGV